MVAPEVETEAAAQAAPAADSDDKDTFNSDEHEDGIIFSGACNGSLGAAGDSSGVAWDCSGASDSSSDDAAAGTSGAGIERGGYEKFMPDSLLKMVKRTFTIRGSVA